MIVINTKVSMCSESDKLKFPVNGSMPSVMYLLPMAVNNEPTIRSNFSSLMSSGKSMLLEAKRKAMSNVMKSLRAIVLECLLR